MAFLEETRLSNIAKDEEKMRVNVWQNEIRNNFANSTKKIDDDDEFDTESLDDDEIWTEDDNDTDWTQALQSNKYIKRAQSNIF